MITVPARLRASAEQAFGSAGRRWCARLPEVFEEFADRWTLTLDLPVGREPWCGFCGIVVPVRTAAGDAAVVKISWADRETAHEHVALRAWGGVGAVRLLDADGPRRVLLLERLDGDRDLRAVSVDEAIEVWAGLMHRLAVPAPRAIPRLADLAAHWIEDLPRRWRAAQVPLEDGLLHEAVGRLRRLAGDAGGLLVHTDMHYENVLAALPESVGTDRWLAIDPKPLAGDPAFAVLPMLWNRLDELDGSDPEGSLVRRLERLADAAGVDVDRARGWCLVRTVETLVWGVEADAIATQAIHRPEWLAGVLTAR